MTEKVFLQSEAGECGICALATVSYAHGLKFDLHYFRRRFPRSIKGMTLHHLMKISSEVGFVSRALKIDLEDLPGLELPAVLHWDLNHFVTLTKLNTSVRGRKTYRIADPAIGFRWIDEQELSAHFTGVALELLPSKTFVPRDLREKFRIRDLWTSNSGIVSALGYLLVMSLVLQVFGLVSPFYMQIVLDDVIPNVDLDFLFVLALGFGFLVFFNAGATWLRSEISLYLSTQFGMQMTRNVFRHTINLPIAWFERRHIGDIVSRFGSIDSIRQFLTNSAIAAVIDGLTVICTVILMAVYSPLLTALVVGALVLYLAARLLTYSILRDKQLEAISIQAAEQSIFMESIRGISALRLFGREAERTELWMNRFTDGVNKNAAIARWNMGFGVYNTVLFGLEATIALYIAAKLIMAGGFTIGMLVAFLAYKTQFTTRAVSLIDQAIGFRMLAIHLERLSDIVLTEAEKPDPDGIVQREAITGQVELRGVGFRYADGEPWVLKDCSCLIEPGKSTAIVGATGAGKTTLAKLILGLLEPSEGQILVNDIPLRDYGKRLFRAQVGSVMQDDQLFAGSIAENIAFFFPHIDLHHMRACAKMASVHNDIMAMPMQYETLVGDMGSSLSGGQKQRVLLARALYANPKMLVLDESTAHLDIATEKAVSEALATLGATKIQIAHRPQTISQCDNVLALENGRVNPLTKNEFASQQALPSLAAE